MGTLKICVPMERELDGALHNFAHFMTFSSALSGFRWKKILGFLSFFSVLGNKKKSIIET